MNEETLMRPDQRIAMGQSEKATRKRADVELKPPVGERVLQSLQAVLSWLIV